jgi:hypothetical protein
VQVGCRLQVGRDAAGREHVEQMLTDARVDVADHRVFGGHQAVVAPAAPRSTPGHRPPLPAAIATGTDVPHSTAARNPDMPERAFGSALWCAVLLRRLIPTVFAT